MTHESNSPALGKRRYGSSALLGVALVSAALSVTLWVFVPRWFGFGSGSSPDAQVESALYQCPMHPTIVRDHPGTCPICGMKLVKVDKAKMSASEDAMGAAPHVHSDEPPGRTLVPGLSKIEIDPARQQLIGLKTAEVRDAELGGVLRTVGRVAVDETRVRRVNLKVAGFVERVFVGYVGKRVKKGDPLFSLYSPELLATQEEYLLARKTQRELAKMTAPVNAEESDLARGARRKLELWDIPALTLEGLEKAEAPSKTLTIYSPVAGVVTKKEVVEGMRLEAGAMPYEITDLSQLWVLVDVYESELRFIRDGMAATLTLSAFPSRTFEGKVVFWDPLLDPATRTVKARLTFPNPNGELRPEMFGDVVLHGTPQRALTVPLDAVIDSGTEKVVFVATGNGKFEPRGIEVGERDQVQIQVTKGLSAGERVVVRANFLVDSESRLRASLSTVADGGAASKPQSARVLPSTAPASSHGGRAP